MNTKLYYEYCSRVLNGEIIAGETIKLACKRFQNDLKRDDLEFREDKVDRAIKFITRVRDKDCVKNRVKRAKIVRFTLC